jgi:Txe/YoeB family toxin of Txe-Axe toxin-antitoxin module
MTHNDDVIRALATLRTFTGAHGHMLPGQIVQAINVLDNAGVFAALDEQTDYVTAAEMAAESAAISATDPWTNIAPDEALQVMHNTWNRRDDHGHRVTVKSAAERKMTGDDNLRYS